MTPDPVYCGRAKRIAYAVGLVAAAVAGVYIGANSFNIGLNFKQNVLMKIWFTTADTIVDCSGGLFSEEIDRLPKGTEHYFAVAIDYGSKTVTCATYFSYIEDADRFKLQKGEGDKTGLELEYKCSLKEPGAELRTYFEPYPGSFDPRSDAGVTKLIELEMANGEVWHTENTHGNIGFPDNAELYNALESYDDKIQINDTPLPENSYGVDYESVLVNTDEPQKIWCVYSRQSERLGGGSYTDITRRRYEITEVRALNDVRPVAVYPLSDGGSLIYYHIPYFLELSSGPWEDTGYFKFALMTADDRLFAEDDRHTANVTDEAGILEQAASDRGVELYEIMDELKEQPIISITAGADPKSLDSFLQ